MRSEFGFAYLSFEKEMLMSDDISLEEFIKLPTTVDFQALSSRSFLEYAAARPAIRPD